jgi:hypothetical protein
VDILGRIRAGSRTVDKASSVISWTLVAGLLLFLVGLPFHLAIKTLFPEPLGTYWKELLLGVLVIVWFAGALLNGRLIIATTPLDWAVLAYAGLLLLRLLMDRSGPVAAWGFYASAMYIPVFWIASAALRVVAARWTGDRVAASTSLLAVLVAVGGLVAIGGLIEFALDVPLWPSEEQLVRQGFPDVYIYGTHIRRVYFTFDSPTTLANTLALLLPLALALVLVQRRIWARLAAGLAAALMVACIVVTFSRGIWVATVLALLGMGLSSGVVRRNRRVLTAAAGGILCIVLVWAGVSAMHSQSPTSGYTGVVELSPGAYSAAPITGVTQDLIEVGAAHGETVTQTWVLPDPIAGRDDTRTVVYQHPPETGKDEIGYRISVPESGALRFGIALSPEVWTPERGDGVSFQIYISRPDGPDAGEFVFVRYINPKHNPSDRRWRNFLLDLSPWSGDSINLSLITEAGPVGDWGHDWAGWSELQVVSVEPSYFASAETENAVLRHTGSVLDWARDETNRDRLAAWSLALNAWRQAPFWGRGLGTTGLAALRTNLEDAFVTESQVLKTLVELGLPGLLALAYLWYQIGRTAYLGHRAQSNPRARALLLGMTAGLLVVFIEGLVYQNLEVKQVNAYFWTLVGTLSFLTTRVDG